AVLVAAPLALLQLDVLAPRLADRARGDGSRLPDLRSVRPLVSGWRASPPPGGSAGSRRGASRRSRPAGRGGDGVLADASHLAERGVGARGSVSRPGRDAAGAPGTDRAAGPDHAPLAAPSQEAAFRGAR